MKQLVLVAGLPRSGSTLLCNILAQNTAVYAHGTSGLLDTLVATRNAWHQNALHQAYVPGLAQQILPNVLRGIVDGYYAHTDCPIILDKNRAWPAYLEMMESVMGGVRPKLLITTRDIRGVLSSLEKLYRKNMASGVLDQEKIATAQFQTVSGRCDVWMREDQPLGIAIARIRDVADRGWWDCVQFVPYETLTCQPQEMMDAIYDFLCLPTYPHGFEHIRQVTFENDVVGHGIDGLHTIEGRLRPCATDWDEVLGKSVADKYVVS